MDQGGTTRAFDMLGLAQRAGAVERGVDAARRAVREGRARLVLIAEDASAAQLKKISGLLEHRNVPTLVAGSRNELGAAVGGPPLSALAVTRREFAEPIVRHLRSESDGGNEVRE